MIHLALIVAFALACGVWAALQLSSGREMDGSCGACSLRDREQECDASPCSSSDRRPGASPEGLEQK